MFDTCNMGQIWTGISVPTSYEHHTILRYFLIIQCDPNMSHVFASSPLSMEITPLQFLGSLSLPTQTVSSPGSPACNLRRCHTYPYTPSVTSIQGPSKFQSSNLVCCTLCPRCGFIYINETKGRQGSPGCQSFKLPFPFSF